MKRLLENRPRKIQFFLFMLLPFLLLNACKKDDNLPPTKPSIELGIPDSMVISAEGMDKGIAFTSNTSWTASSDVEWITISNKSGSEGKDTVLFSVAENTGAERTGNITISADGGDLSKMVEIIQRTGLSPNFFVKADATGEGHSWAQATDLTTALGSAAAGDTIFVAAGTYVPSKTITGGDPGQNGDKTFEINKNITLIGGYPANASRGATANPETNETILSGDLGNGDSTYHIVVVTAPKAQGENVLINGFTLTHGNGNGPTGGAGSFTINGATVYRNNSGGISIINSSVEINNCKIIDNKARSGAAGIFMNNGDVTIRNTKVNSNEGGSGGAIWLYGDSKLTIYDSEIKDNIAHGVAGAIYAYQRGHRNELYVYNTIIKGNSNNSYGAAVYYRNADGALVNCLIEGNSSTSKNGGGGLLMYGGCDVAVISCTITGNDVTQGENSAPGGGIYARSGDNKLHIYNSIVSGNIQAPDSKDIDWYKSDLTIDKGAIISGADAFDASGNQITGVVFTASTDLSTGFIPTGSNNPALTEGMNASALSALSVSSSLDVDYLKKDMDGNSRSGKTIMGALLP